MRLWPCTILMLAVVVVSFPGTAVAVDLTSVSLSSPSVPGGGKVLLHLTLSGPAPSGGLAVSLTSSNLTVATVPASITVAAGASTASFPVTTKPVGQTSTVGISASVGGVIRTANLQVTPPPSSPIPIPIAFTLNPISVLGGAKVAGHVTLSGTAPSGGLAVGLASSNLTVATVPASVTIAPGVATAGFLVATKAVAQTSTVSISVSVGGVTKSALLEVTRNVPIFTINPTNFVGGATVTGKVTLSGPAPLGGIDVGLTSSQPTLATVPASVRVGPGTSTASFPVTTKRPGQITTVGISASVGGVTKTVYMSLSSQLIPITVTLNPTSVPGGATVTGQVTLNGLAPTGGWGVDLRSSNLTVATVPASVTVAAGKSGASFSVMTKLVVQTSSVVISASTGGAIRKANLQVTPNVREVTLNPTSVPGGATVMGKVTLSGPAPSGGFAVGLTSSQPTVATVPASVTVAAGAMTASFGVTTKPVGQTSTVSISASVGGVTRKASLQVTP